LNKAKVHCQCRYTKGTASEVTEAVPFYINDSICRHDTGITQEYKEKAGVMKWAQILPSATEKNRHKWAQFYIT